MSKKTGILANEANANARAAADAQYLRQFEDSLRHVASTKLGRLFLARLIFDTCKVMVSDDKPTNAEIYIITGKRMVGEHLLGSLEALEPNVTRTMVDEWFNDRFERRAVIERAGNKPDGDEE